MWEAAGSVGIMASPLGTSLAENHLSSTSRTATGGFQLRLAGREGSAALFLGRRGREVMQSCRKEQR